MAILIHCGIILVVYQNGMYQCTLHGLSMWQMTGKIAKVMKVNLEKYYNISCVLVFLMFNEQVYDGCGK